MTWGEIAITIFVVALVLFSAWRAGQANPIGTGRLARRISALELKVDGQGHRMDVIDASVSAIGERIGMLNAGVEAVDNQLTALRVEVAGDRGLTERTWASVSRLEGFFIQDAFQKRGGGA